MAETEIIYVAVIPLDNPDTNVVKTVSETIGKDAYHTRLLLMGTIPRIVVRCNGAGEAEATARKLREAGLTTIVISDAELRKPFRGVRANTMRFSKEAVEFVQEDGRDVKLGVGGVFLIIKGTRHPAPAAGDAPAKTKVKLAVGTSLVMGGLPVFKKVKEKPSLESSQPEWFLRLYERNSSEPRAEILQYEMEYSFLGEEKVPSSTANFINITRRLREKYPQAIYDESLMKTFATDIPGTTPDEDMDINCRLIYFQHLP
jgi:hypothetical protein